MNTLKTATLKFSASFAAMAASVLCLRFTHMDLFFFVFMAAFVVSILYWMELGQELRDLPDPSGWQWILGLLFGVPQALFGLVCIASGLAMVGWVLYNSFVERSEFYTGGFLTLGISPALIGFGAFWLVLAFKRSPPFPDGDDSEKQKTC